MSGSGYTRGKSTTDLTSGSGSATMESQAADSLEMNPSVSQEDPVTIDDGASCPADDSQVDSQVPLLSPSPPAVDANGSEGGESEEEDDDDDDDDGFLPYQMSFLADGTVQHSGAGGPDIFTLQLAGMLQQFVSSRLAQKSSAASSASAGGVEAKKDGDDEKEGPAEDNKKKAAPKKKIQNKKPSKMTKKKKH